MPTLQRLLQSSHRVVGVITQPDRPAGRGRKLTAPPVKDLALEHGLPVLQPEKVKTDEFAAQVKELGADVAVVIAYGRILPRRILDTPRHGCLNVHASLLPAYRGAAPIQWALVNGELKTGVTIMQMDEGMDTGPMVAQEDLDILDDDDATSLGAALSLIGANLMIGVLDRLEQEGSLRSEPQNHADATAAPLIKREMARINWSQGHEKVICAVRGFVTWPKAYTTLEGMELKITGAEAWHRDWVPATAFDARVQPGTIVELVKGRGFVVRTGGEHGLVLVTRVQPPGRGEMSAQDLANGGTVDVGMVLGT